MIRLEAVDKHYRSAQRTLHVIDSVSLSIPKGSFFSLVGPSGSGKTTTLRLLAGLERHDRGKIFFGDRLVSDPGRSVFVPASGRDIGMVFQSYAIWPHMDVFDNVAYPLRQKRSGCPRGEIAGRVSDVLELVGLKDLIHAPAPMLSGGQQQRVALARALVGRPEILLLDEPLSNLDAQLREHMRLEIRDLQRRLGITTLYVTHDRTEALSMSTTVAVMNAGRIEMIGSPADIYERPASLFTAEFLGQCNLLIGKVARRDGAGLAMVETAYGPFVCETPDSCTAGRSVRIILRPEDIVLTAPTGKPPDSSRWQGVLSKISYFGDRLDCEVTLPGGGLHVFAHRSIAPLLGQTVSITPLADRLWAIPAESETP